MFLHHLKVLYAVGDPGISTSPSEASKHCIGKTAPEVVFSGGGWSCLFDFSGKIQIYGGFSCNYSKFSFPWLFAGYNQLVTQVP